MFLNLFSRKPEFDLFPMTPDDCRAMSELHSARFARGWGDGEFHSLLTQGSVFGSVARQTNHNDRPLAGFVLSRQMADESEILTIAVESRFGGAGLGWRLMQAAIREARNQGAVSMFLEVDEGNEPALRLYRKLGFAKVGERRGYYEQADGKKTGALVMRLDLR